MADGVVHLPPADPSTGAKQDTGNASVASIDGKVTACNTGAVVVASSALPTDAATQTTLAALNAKVTAVNTGAVVVSSSALPSGAATEAKQDTGNTSLASILTKFTDTLARFGVLGANGSAIASASNGVPVTPETASLWDVKDRAARLLGALTGINGSGVATGANPVPVQLSSGTAVITTGIALGATSIPQVPAAMAVVSGASLATTGVLLKSGPGIVGYGNFTNSTGGAVYWQFHNTTSTPAGAARPLEAAAATVASGATVKIYPGNGVPGLPCDTGIFLILSSTQWTYTAIASTNAIYAFTVY